MRRTLIAILCAVIWLFVGQVSEQVCGEHALRATVRSTAQGSITDSDRGTICRAGDDMLLPASSPVAVERCGGAVSVRGAARRAGHGFTKIFVPEIAYRHTGRVTHTLDFDIRRSTLCVKHYLHVLRRLRI